MTGERRKHVREPIPDSSMERPGDRPGRSREPAEAHFRHLHDERGAPPAAPPADGADDSGDPA
jgi:hypothetical protein